MDAKITALSFGCVMFWTPDTFNPEDYDARYRIRPSGVHGQHRIIDGKLVDVSGVRHWIAEPEFAAVIQEDK